MEKCSLKFVKVDKQWYKIEHKQIMAFMGNFEVKENLSIEIINSAPCKWCKENGFAMMYLCYYQVAYRIGLCLGFYSYRICLGLFLLESKNRSASAYFCLGQVTSIYLFCIMHCQYTR